MFCRPDEGVEALTRSLHALPRAGICGAGETQRRNILASVCELRAKSEEVLQRGLVWPLKATILACERAGKSGAASCSTRAAFGKCPGNSPESRETPRLRVLLHEL